MKNKFYLVIFPFIIFSTNCNAERYECEINAIKNLKTKSIKNIEAQNRLKIVLEKNQDYIDLKIKNNKSRLNYAESGKILGYLNVDIFINSSEQLEIIDIEQNYSSGARYFYKNNMYLIGGCQLIK